MVQPGRVAAVRRPGQVRRAVTAGLNWRSPEGSEELSNDVGLGLMGVQLQPLNEPDDPILIITAVLNQPVVSGRVDLHRREDLELWSALHALHTMEPDNIRWAFLPATSQTES
jgi:hypothetical protein